MRREQIHKICLNHALTSDIKYTWKNEKNLMFSVGDYSEGELEVRSFLLRFKTSEVANDFKNVIDSALSGIVYENGHGAEETKEMNEDQKLIEKLQLPADFFEYKKADSSCKGCPGCNDEAFTIPEAVTSHDDFIPLDFNVVKRQLKGRKPKRVSFSLQEEKMPVTTVAPLTDAKSIFSSALNTIAPVKEGTGIFGSKATFGSQTPSIFGSAANFMSAQNTSKPTIFGGGSNQATPLSGLFSNASSFSFSAAASDLTASASNGNTTPADENKNSGLFWKHDSVSFATIANSGENNAFSAKANEGAGFFGLTKKDDIFTKLAKQKAGGALNESKEEDDQNANDENYDPHYDPIIQLPDEIEVKTGEEDEVKLFGERSKLFRFCAETKQWKERGKV